MLFSLVTIVFFLIRVVPGNPTAQYYSPKLGEEISNVVKSNFGLDQPITIQYFKWLKNFLQGDLGYSINYKRPVVEIISEALPTTIVLATSSLILQMLIGIMIGVYLGLRNGSKIDNLISNFSLIIFCTPTFFIGVILIFVLSIQLGIFPSSNLHSIDFEEASFFNKAFDYLYHLILPISVLTISSAAFSIRFMRDIVIEVFNQQFITSLISTGISRKKLITILGLEIGSLLGGSLITETIFSLPGIGRLSVEAVLVRDYPLIIACTILSGVMVIIGNFIADVLYTKLDPRISIDAIA
jgi:peptide/nickel transport system permease protein